MSKNVWIRILTGLSMLCGLFFVLLLRQFLTVYIVDIVLLVILFFAVYEVMRATKAKTLGIKYHYVFAYLSFAYLLFFIGTVVASPFGLITHIAVQAALLIIFIIYTFFMYYVDPAINKQCKLKKIKVGAECRRILHSYLKIIGYPAAFIFTLFALNHFDSASSIYTYFGIFTLLLVFAISAATDTCAYAVGVLIKGPKLCPKISPKKTWSGAIGGLFGGVIASLAVVFILSDIPEFGTYFLQKGIDKWIGLLVFGLIGLFGSIATQAGDIFASFIKRKHNIKDFGKILPGHGGVMDRIDGIIFCSVFIFVIMTIICFIL